MPIKLTSIHGAACAWTPRRRPRQPGQADSNRRRASNRRGATSWPKTPVSSPAASCASKLVVGEAADVVIDFSVPDAGIAIVYHCLQSKKPLVIATTGFEPDQKEFIAAAADQIPIVSA